MIPDNTHLLSRLQSGDESARDLIIENNMGLVYNIVNKFQNRGYEREDLIQIGSIGLIKAVKKFDNSLGVQFSTYAVPVILGEIKRFLRDDGAIKVSRSLKEIAMRGRRCEEKLNRELGRTPTVMEISKDCGIEEGLLLEAFEASMPVESIYKSVGDDESLSLMNILEGENVTDKVIDKIYINESFHALTQREKEIINLRYYKGKTQSDIAKVMGVSQVQISRLEKKALLKMRDVLEKQ